MTNIGFIGTGVMGISVVEHLLKNDHAVTVYNRTKAKAETLLTKGAVWAETPQNVAETSDIIFTMVGYPVDVEDVYYGEKGIFKADVANKVLIDLTTSTPSLAEKINQTAKEKHAEALDAPVSGGDLGAKKGTLTIMVGGDEQVFNDMKEIFQLFSSSLELHGPAGSGQHTKMANQIMVAGTMTGLTEMLVYAEKAELDLKKVVKTLSGGAAGNWSLENYSPRILKEDYSAGFFVKHFIKDLSIALDEAEKMGLNLPSTKLAKELYEQLSQKGHAEDGTQALIKLWWENE
ncbi:3-hydroxyisobutyrate dehydrogenase [Alkalibacterium putridalgicola]|uniref:2-hydroxy-3-oxopropionate reductase n=1 Tax=Alkalibacterium putridalgicola TaxID=426703 RepID=A0A1H7SXB7_9LACT|nr:NAD(P)-dependent oxidoreductase [Alkalibacterium putridalgicola]GEK89209.1 2-hydroxy-3-oxopropionate reductase [Alkalibacterium putridalgicola]SEL76604.1 3-hydroxyisobutyrate dehydrogenase [Alkalibacterium putridalgicola]